MTKSLTTNSVVKFLGVRGGRRTAVALATLATLVAAVPASADPPARITIVSVFEPIAYGDNDYVNGQLIGPTSQAGQPVALEQSAPPFTDWTPVGQVAADAQGYYSFKLHPTQTMQYRTSSQGLASERLVQISVTPRLRLRAQSAGRTSIRFSGTMTPALVGQSIAIQRRTRTGSWKAIARVKLHSGKTFAGRIRASRPTVLRAFFAGDPAHLGAYSNPVSVTAG